MLLTHIYIYILYPLSHIPHIHTTYTHNPTHTSVVFFHLGPYPHSPGCRGAHTWRALGPRGMFLIPFQTSYTGVHCVIVRECGNS